MPDADFDARCWCGGEVGSRTPGDGEGRGCLENILHAWQAPPAPRTQNGLHNLLICCGPILPGGTPGCCRILPPAVTDQTAEETTPWTCPRCESDDPHGKPDQCNSCGYRTEDA